MGRREEGTRRRVGWWVGNALRRAGHGRITTRAAALTGLLAATACGNGPTDPESFQPPNRYAVVGSASGTAGTSTIACAFEFVLTWDGAERLEMGGRVFVASGVGEVERRVQGPDGSGTSFTPVLGLEEHWLRMTGGDRLLLESPADLDTGIPFWDGIARMPGVITGPATARGTWSCAPTGVAGDSVGTVDGTWRLEARP
ncbi:MAG TPA: hypothetical protein VK858_22300 [Longimicrobiales bacterium]|nr:hypothetical protein [Longimicrobiales bacterium]